MNTELPPEQEQLSNQPPSVPLPNANVHRQPLLPLAYTTRINSWRVLQLGCMDIPCLKCGALHWIDERSHPSTKSAPRFESCCKKGAVVLERLPDTLNVLMRLLSTEKGDGKQFRKRIREYNSTLSFTSLKYSPDERTTQLGPRIQGFQIHGELYDLQGPLNLLPQQPPRFA